ncbi:hypothetical protein EH105704_01_02560 [Atlantibacter hermannii NBRC 105704]|uniref:Uncharacterized protein n=1 Tax=Atlantibacter hermannii NBRC 105704 TaxID=1115512 RepID=H5UWG8_ATLHE|nr:hypothetical protein EH105704_01_02560 [Atlantibacter hermannii NBRC 105704]
MPTQEKIMLLSGDGIYRFATSETALISTPDYFVSALNRKQRRKAMSSKRRRVRGD